MDLWGSWRGMEGIGSKKGSKTINNYVLNFNNFQKGSIEQQQHPVQNHLVCLGNSNHCVECLLFCPWHLVVFHPDFWRGNNNLLQFFCVHSFLPNMYMKQSGGDFVCHCSTLLTESTREYQNCLRLGCALFPGGEERSWCGPTLHWRPSWEVKTLLK